MIILLLRLSYAYPSCVVACYHIFLFLFLAFFFKVYDLGLGRPKYPINGLEFLRVPNTNQYLIIVAAPDYIFTFQETLRSDEKSLQAIFTGYVNGTQSHGFETAKTDLNYSVLKLYAQPGEKFASLWGWLCGSGIRHGRVSKNNYF